MAEPEILIGVGGSIAAYKAADVVSDLKKRGANLTVLLTPAAARFVSPLTLAVMSGRPVGLNLFEEPAEWGVGHVTLAKRAKLYLIVAATADLLAKLAHGMADDFVSTCALVARCPILVAPAMNTAMWEHPATQANMALLRSRGLRFVEPGNGLLACGDLGIGKLADAQQIADQAWKMAMDGSAPRVQASKGKKKSNLEGKKVLITAGPTREPLDPVRFLSNPSTGKMGYALAEAARLRGAEVLLVSGPTQLAGPQGVERVSVRTAREMMQAAGEHFRDCAVFISAAAVSDFRPETAVETKVKKDGKPQVLKLVPNPDILASLAREKGRRCVVGFAAETDHLLEYAAKKLRAKNLDMLVANDVSRAGSGFGVDTNQATLLWPGRKPLALPLMGKDELAGEILNEIEKLI